MDQPTITNPNIALTVDQLKAVVSQLDEAGRAQLAQVLVRADMDAKLKALMERIADLQSDPALTDLVIREEVAAVRSFHGRWE